MVKHGNGGNFFASNLKRLSERAAKYTAVTKKSISGLKDSKFKD